MEKNTSEEKRQVYLGFVMGQRVMRKPRLKHSYPGTKKHPLKGKLLGMFLKERFTYYNY